MVLTFIDEKMAAARDMAAHLAEDAPDDVAGIYLAGSLTAGLGNAGSDADLFVLHTAEGDRPTQQYTLGRHRIDVEHYPATHPSEAIAELTGFQLANTNIGTLWGFPDKLDFVFRLATSETIVDSELMQRIRADLETAWPRLRSTAVNYWALALNSDLEDFGGACGDGDLDTATYVGQVLLTSAGKALVAACDDTYFGRKWVYKQLRRSAPEGFPLDAFRAFQRGDWAAEGTAGADRALAFAQTCVLVGQLLGQPGIEEISWPNWLGGSGGFWRHPGYTVLHLGDRVLLHWELTRQVTLSPRIAVVWGLCQGNTGDEVVGYVEALAPQLPMLSELTADDVVQIVGRLVDRGLVSHEPISILQG